MNFYLIFVLQKSTTINVNYLRNINQTTFNVRERNTVLQLVDCCTVFRSEDVLTVLLRDTSNSNIDIKPQLKTQKLQKMQ